MTTERIKEIQSKTAYPESASVQQALLQVWNEVAQKYETFNTKREMKIRIFSVWSQAYITPYIKITHNRDLNGYLEFIIGWLKWEIVIGI